MLNEVAARWRDGRATRKAVELALVGDVTALHLGLERLVPPCREARVTLDLPRLETRADAPRVLSLLLAEAGRGEVTPGEAEKLARLVSEVYGPNRRLQR